MLICPARHGGFGSISAQGSRSKEAELARMKAKINYDWAYDAFG